MALMSYIHPQFRVNRNERALRSTETAKKLSSVALRRTCIYILTNADSHMCKDNVKIGEPWITQLTATGAGDRHDSRDTFGPAQHSSAVTVALRS